MVLRSQRIDHMVALVVIVVSIVIDNQNVYGAKSAKSIRTNSLKCGVDGDNQNARNLARFTVYSKKYGRNWPINRKELKSFCRESSTLLHQIDQYRSKCYKGQLKQFSSLFVFSSRNMIKRFCGRGAKHRKYNELFQLAQCVNKHKDSHNRCMEKLIEAFVGIKYAEDAKKIPHSCCAISEISNCFGQQMVKDGCGDKRDLMEEIFHSGFDNVGPICNEYNQDSDRCSSLGPRPKKKPKEKIPDSILMPFYDIVNSLPQ